jgi:hypothetical protein
MDMKAERERIMRQDDVKRVGGKAEEVGVGDGSPMTPSLQPLRKFREVINMEKLTYKNILDAVGGKNISLAFEMRGEEFIMKIEGMPKSNRAIGIFDGIKSIV